MNMASNYLQSTFQASVVELSVLISCILHSLRADAIFRQYLHVKKILMIFSSVYNYIYCLKINAYHVIFFKIMHTVSICII